MEIMAASAIIILHITEEIKSAENIVTNQMIIDFILSKVY